VSADVGTDVTSRSRMARHQVERPPGRLRRMVRAGAGPTLIVVAVLVVLRSYAFRGMITTQHGDILEFWLPVFGNLGRALRSGHIPVFDPYSLGGHPFAADPQSGWMYVPAMLLFTVLSAGTAIRWFIVIQPILAGLGAYWFLRAEQVNRPASTAGGLVMALVMADSHIGLELPFAGAIAWTMLSLAAAARFVRSDRWGPRLVWLALTAIAWGQIAAAHLSHGLVTGTALLVVYVVFRLASRAGDGRDWRRAAAMLVVLLGSLAAVNLAYLLPRISYLPHTSLGLGYAQLNDLAARLSGQPPPPVRPGEGLFVGADWPFGLASAPGAYLGAAALALSFAGLWSKRHRGLTIMLLSFGFAFYVLSLHGVATRIGPHITWVPFADFYVHAPVRFRYGVIAVLPLLTGIGAHAWITERGWRVHLWMAATAVAFWWLLNAASGRPGGFPELFVVGSLAAVAVLAAVVWRPSLAWAIPLLLLVELTANGVFGARVPRQDTGSPWGPNLTPMVKIADYLKEGELARVIAGSGGDRYVTLAPRGQGKPGRSFMLVHPETWPGLANGRGSLFRTSAADGYNPTQLLRYWEFVRAVDGRRLTYNSSSFAPPVQGRAIDLLAIRWILAPRVRGPQTASAKLVATEGNWGLYEVRPAPDRASFSGSWRVVGSPDAARRAVLSPGFDPSTNVILEPDSGMSSVVGPRGTGGAGTAVYRDDGAGRGTVLVDARTPGVVLIRNPYAPGWQATVDGRPARVMPADFVDMAVAVPAGRHVVRMTYSDPAIGRGLLGSGAALVILLALAGIATLRYRRREGEGLGMDFEREPHPATTQVPAS
jgi:hypothetical protein